MIQFSIYDDEDKKLRITAPHSWRELNLSQLVDIEDEDKQSDGLIKLFSIICGIEFKTVAQSTDKSLYKLVRDVCAFIASPPDWEKLPFPKYLEIGGDVYKSPTSVNNLMHGQIELLTEVGRDGNLLKDTARTVAIIMQPYMDKESNNDKLIYDSERVDKIEAQVLLSSGLEALGFAMFFFLKLSNFLGIGINNSLKYLKETPRKATYYEDWLMVTDLSVLQP